MKNFTVLTSRENALSYFLQLTGGRYDASTMRFYPNPKRWMEIAGYTVKMNGSKVFSCYFDSSKMLTSFVQMVFDTLSTSYIDMESLTIRNTKNMTDYEPLNCDYNFLCDAINGYFYRTFGVDMESAGEVFMDIDECIRQYQARSGQVHKEIA